MPKQTTIHDIAKELNMAASTVSRALANNTRISQTTRNLVQQTAERMNYKPNIMAANLRRGKAHTIGLIVPRISRNFFSTIINGVEKVMNPAGYQILVCQSNEHLQKELENVKALVNNRVDGIIISTVADASQTDHLSWVLKSGIPMIQFDRIQSAIDTPTVTNDDLSAAKRVVLHLIQQGYSNIVHFGGPSGHSTFNNRAKGYHEAMFEQGLSAAMVFEDVLSEEKAYQKALELLTSEQRPDAFFTASDWSAVGVLKACKLLNLSVPHEVGIFGFANDPFCDLITPGLSSVEQFSEQIGELAAKELMLAMEKDNNKIPVQNHLVPCELKKRESSQKKASPKN